MPVTLSIIYLIFDKIFMFFSYVLMKTGVLIDRSDFLCYNFIVIKFL